jgi:hypothetical protein
MHFFRFILSTYGFEYGHVRVRDFTTMGSVRTIELCGWRKPIHIVPAPDNQHVLFCEHDGYHPRNGRRLSRPRAESRKIA